MHALSPSFSDSVHLPLHGASGKQRASGHASLNQAEAGCGVAETGEDHLKDLPLMASHQEQASVMAGFPIISNRRSPPRRPAGFA